MAAAALASSDRAALELLRERGGALCTIVSVDGSFSRQVGAHLAIAEDGEIAGSLSDGCLEKELAIQARHAASRGTAALLRYGAGSPFIDFRLPCGAGIDVLVEPRPDRKAIGAVCDAMGARRRATLELASAGGEDRLTRTYLPPVRLLILGIGPEVAELAALARAFGAEVELPVPGRDFSLHRPPLDIAVDPWTAIVLLFHDHEWEAEVLRWALGTTAFYIGSVGGRLVRATRRDRLRQQGFDDATIDRVHGPLGLIPAAREPATLALSILSEVVGEYHRLRRQVPALVREPARNAVGATVVERIGVPGK